MTTKFKKGKYYIGDPCYVISDKEWNSFCNASFDTNDSVIPWKDGITWAHGTHEGDGTYYDQDKREYGVDSGLIGCTPFEYYTKLNYSIEKLESLGQIVQFDKPFTCEYNDGIYTIGHIVIDTSGENND